MRKGLLLLTAVIIAIAMPMSLAAQEKEIEVEVKVCEESCKGELHKGHKGCKSECKIDAVTKLKLEKLHIELKLENLELEKAKKEIHKKMHEEYLGEKPSRKSLDKLSKKLLDIEAKLMSNKHDYMFKAREFATAKQIMSLYKGHAGQCCGKGSCNCMGHGGMKGHSCGSMDHKCGSSCKTTCGSGGKGCGHHVVKGEKMIWIEKDGDAPHVEKIIKHLGEGDGEEHIIMIKCDDTGCGHKDKSECTDECLKKRIKVIKEKIEKEVEKEKE